MTDVKIPTKCRTCKHCKRYSEGLLLQYSWVPWDWECEIGRNRCKYEVL